MFSSRQTVIKQGKKCVHTLLTVFYNCIVYVLHTKIVEGKYWFIIFRLISPKPLDSERVFIYLQLLYISLIFLFILILQAVRHKGNGFTWLNGRVFLGETESTLMRLFKMKTKYNTYTFLLGITYLLPSLVLILLCTTLDSFIGRGYPASFRKDSGSSKSRFFQQ